MTRTLIHFIIILFWISMNLIFVRTFHQFNPEHFSRGDLNDIYSFGIRRFLIYYQNKILATLHINASESNSIKNSHMLVLNMAMRFKYRSSIYDVSGDGYFLYDKEQDPLRLRMKWMINREEFLILGQGTDKGFQIRVSDRTGEVITQTFAKEAMKDLLSHFISTFYQDPPYSGSIIPGLDIKGLSTKDQEIVVGGDPPDIDFLENYGKYILR